eukprot:4596527-Pleurochrysis_carterae.AAC.1
MSVASTCVGTPLYLAPELCEGKEYNNKCDVWSLGAILYELCALQPPFTANNMPALVMRICAAEPPPMPKSFSEQLCMLALLLLSKEPTQRPRVHDVLAEPFIQSRIETFLDVRCLQEEFSHTILHDGGSLAAEVDAAARAGSKPKGAAAHDEADVPRSNSRPGARPAAVAREPNGVCSSAARRRPNKPGSGGGGGSGGNVRAGGRENAEDEAMRTQLRREADQKREEQREQMRRDRQVARKKATDPAFEIVMA